MTLNADVFQEFQELITRLRKECPWDKKQTHESLKRHLLEEAYEVIEAIDGLSENNEDKAKYDALKDELGDLLYQVFFHSLLASEVGQFDIEDVIQNTHEKLHRRHPHIFGDLEIETTEELAPHWEEIKKSEKETESVMDKLSASLPALLFAAKVQKKARALKIDPLNEKASTDSRVDFDAAVRQIKDGLFNLNAIRVGLPHEVDIEKELGELLWAITALALNQELDAEDVLRKKAKAFAEQVRRQEIQKPKK